MGVGFRDSGSGSGLCTSLDSLRSCQGTAASAQYRVRCLTAHTSQLKFLILFWGSFLEV